MKVRLCIAVVALFALKVRESDCSVKEKTKESDNNSIGVALEDKTTKFNISESGDSVKTQNSKHKRGIFHYGAYGVGPALGWPSQYASIYGYNLHLPPQGIHVARGLHSVAHNHPSVHGYPIAHGLPTGYGLPAFHGVQAVQPLHGIHSHGIQPLPGVPSVQTLQHGVGVHVIQPSHPVSHGVQAGIPSGQYPWHFKSHTASHGTPFVLKPGGAVVSSFNVNYPQHNHHQHIPTGIAFPSITNIAASIPVSSVAAAIPIAPARPVSPVVPVVPAVPAVPAIPAIPTPPQSPTVPSFISQPNFPLFVNVVPPKPTLTTPIGNAVPPSQFFPNIGVLPLQPLEPTRPQRPSGGNAESSGSAIPLPQLPPSPTQQPWRPVLNPQQPQQPQQPQLPQQPQQPHFPQQTPTTISTIPDFNRPSITLLPPFINRPQGGEAVLPDQFPNIPPHSQSPNNPAQSQGYHYGVGESVQPSLLDGLTDEEIQAAIAQANFQAQLHQNNNRGYQ